MRAAHVIPPDPRSIDQRVYLRGRSWADLLALLRARGDAASPRLTYLEGTIELMAPSRAHELDKKKLARLLEAWSESQGVELEGYGSFTVKNEGAERAAEADESYVLGARNEVAAPDIAIEVVWTAGGLDKLEVWRKLGAREVWFWEGGKLTFHVLHGDRYTRAERSALLPALDPPLIEACMQEPSQAAALARLRAATHV